MNTKPHPYYPNLQQGIGIFVLFIFLSMIFGMISSVGYINQQPLLKDLSILLSYLLSAGGTLLIIVRIKKMQNPEIPTFRNYTPQGKTIAIALVLTLPLIVIAEALTSLVPMPEWYKDVFAELFKLSVPSFITAIIVAPLLEEMIFRGIILDGFLRNFSPGKSILLASLLFGIAHLNFWQFLGAFMIGLFIGWVYWQTKSLGLAIGIHMFNNLVSFIAMYFSPESASETTIRDFAGDAGIYYAILGVSVLLLVAGYFTRSYWLPSNKE